MLNSFSEALLLVLVPFWAVAEELMASRKARNNVPNRAREICLAMMKLTLNA